MKGLLINIHRLAFTVFTMSLFCLAPHVLAGSQCGNLTLDESEQCDDGNQQNGDGCSSVCLIEHGFECTSPYVPLDADNAIVEPGFENGDSGAAWVDQSSLQLPNFCNLDDCPTGPGARFGAHWWQMGGVEGETWYLSQEVDIPLDYRYLRFNVQNVACAEPETPDFYYLTINGVEIWTFTTDDPDCTGPVPNYRTVTIDLDTAPEGPYDGIGTVEIALTGTPATPETVLAFDNIQISKAAGGTVPSICSLKESVQAFDPFEGISDVLGPPDYEQGFNGEIELPWGTTDDGFCGNSGDLPPGNFTGGAGEAACIDSTSFNSSGSQLIESYFCLSPIDLRDRTETLLSLFINYQPVEETGNDFFGIWASDQPFFGPLDNGIDDAVFFTNEPLGEFGEAPGIETVIDLMQLDGLPEVYLCFGYGNEGTGYAQMDTIILSSTGCIDDYEEDKLQSCIDNCIDVANPMQRDSDDDGIGNACDGDIARNVSATRAEGGNGNDCIVNFQDLFTLSQAMFSDPLSQNWNPDADFNSDNIVNFLDLSLFSEMFLMRPGPSAFNTTCDEPEAP